MDLGYDHRHVISLAARLEIAKVLASLSGKRRPIIDLVAQLLRLQTKAISRFLQVYHLSNIDSISFLPRHRLLYAVDDISLVEVVPDAV